MKHIKPIAVLFISLIFLYSPSLKSQCVRDTNNIYSFIYDNAKYEVVKETKTWTGASACAVERGGKLTEINSKEEQDSIFFHINNAGIIASNTTAPDGGGSSYLWIGGNDLAVEGQWVWNGDNDTISVQFWQGTRTGSAVGGLYNNWGNEPDNWSNQDAIGLALTNWPLGTAGQWNDIDHTNTLYFVIEYDQDLSGIIEPAEVKKTINIFPNPASDRVKISIKGFHTADNNNTISIYNTIGMVIKKVIVNKTEFDISLSNMNRGIYFLILETSDYVSPPAKLIVK
ncbi:T9SS type A sorting domain-containing protein [Bacteroidota bacterium]